MPLEKRLKNTSPVPKTERIAPDALGVIQPRNFPGLPEGWVTETASLPSKEAEVFFVLHHSMKPIHGRALLVVHGLGEHGGRYLHLPHFLEEQVSWIATVDLRGHGRSTGTRGYVSRFEEYVDDVLTAYRALVARLKAEGLVPEVHLLGHSMGGLVALRTIQREPTLELQTVTLTAPLLGIRAPVPWVKELGAKLMQRVWSSMQLASGLDPHHLSRDIEVVRAYQGDRLVHDKVTPALFSEMQSAMKIALDSEDSLNHPVLFIIPGADPIVSSEATLGFAERVKAPEKRVKSFPQFFHEPMNEPGKESVFEEISTWIKQHRLSGASSSS